MFYFVKYDTIIHIPAMKVLFQVAQEYNSWCLKTDSPAEHGKEFMSFPRMAVWLSEKTDIPAISNKNKRVHKLVY